MKVNRVIYKRDQGKRPKRGNLAASNPGDWVTFLFEGRFVTREVGEVLISLNVVVTLAMESPYGKVDGSRRIKFQDIHEIVRREAEIKKKMNNGIRAPGPALRPGDAGYVTS